MSLVTFDPRCFECWFRFNVLAFMFGWEREDEELDKRTMEGSCPLHIEVRKKLGMPYRELPDA